MCEHPAFSRSPLARFPLIPLSPRVYARSEPAGSRCARPFPLRTKSHSPATPMSEWDSHFARGLDGPPRPDLRALGQADRRLVVARVHQHRRVRAERAAPVRPPSAVTADAAALAPCCNATRRVATQRAVRKSSTAQRAMLGRGGPHHVSLYASCGAVAGRAGGAVAGACKESRELAQRHPLGRAAAARSGSGLPGGVGAALRCEARCRRRWRSRPRLS